MKVLYVTGANTEGPDATTEQLTRLSPDLKITTVSSAAQALEETRTAGGFRALLTSPWLAHNDTLSLIVSLRRDRVPIAIVPVLTEAQRDFFASAVAAGADDVLLLRGETLLRANETLTRIRQSPHLSMAAERRRLRVLYAGVDDRVWTLLEQVPFVVPERATTGVDGGCPVRTPGTSTNELRCDVVIIDQPPGEAHPLQVLKSVKSQASDLPVIVLAPAGAGDVETAALDLGADDTVLKSGIYRRRLIATLRRVHQRFEIVAQHQILRAREARLRQIVESLPQGVGVISEDFSVLAMNAAALALFGATKPTDVVGRDFRTFVADADRDEVAGALRRTTDGEPSTVRFALAPTAGTAARSIEISGVPLERDARGGRGVVAVFRTGDAVPAAAAEVDPEEIDRLEQEVVAAIAAAAEAREAAEAAHQREIDAHRLETEAEALLASERSAWESMRRALEAKLEDAEADAARRSEAEASLADVLTLERSAWDETRRTLESRAAEAQAEAAARLAEATAARIDLERALEEARAQLRDAEAAREAGRLAADAESARLRDTLETEIADLRRAHEAGLADAQGARAIEVAEARRLRDADVAAARRQHEADLAEVRHQLEAAMADLARAHAAEMAEAERARETALVEREDAHASDRASWAVDRGELERAAAEAADQRQHLEARLREADAARAATEAELQAARAAASTPSHADVDLEALRVELATTAAAADAARAAWEAERASTAQDALQSREALEASLRDLTATTTARDARIHELESGWAALEAARADADTRRGEAESVRADLESTLRESLSAADALRRELEAVSAARSHLQQALDEQHESRDAWQQRERDLVASLEEARAAARSADERRQHAENRLQDLEQRLGDLEARRQDADRRVQEIEARRQDADRRVQEIEARRQDADRRVQEIEAGRQEADRRVQEIEAGRQEADRRVQELEARVAALDAERRDADRVRAEAEQRRLDLEQSLQARDEDLRAREQQVRERDEQLREREQQVRDRDDQIRERDQQLRERDQQLRERDAQLDAVRQERHADTQAVTAALQAELRQAADDHAAERGTWEALKQEFERRLADHESRQDDLQAALDALRAERDARLAEADAARAERDARHAEVEAVRHDAERRLADIASLQADLERRLEDAQTSRRVIEQRGAAADAERDALRAEIRTLGAEHASLAGALDAERAARARDRQEIDVVRQAFDHERARRVSLRDQLQESERQSDLARVALDAESAARRALEHQLADLDRDLRARLAQADARIVALTADLDQARSTRARVAESPLVGRALTTRDGRLVECNDTFATFFGYADADDMVSRQTNTPLQGLGQVVIDTRGGGRAANRLHDLTITRVDGQTVRLRESHAAVTAPDGRELVEHIVVDASATLRLEEQLRQARRLEEVGSLAASMAPDIESRLLAVADAGSRLRDAVPGSDPRRVSADAVLTNLDDAVVLVRQLWSFSQRQVRPLEATDLNDAVRRAEPTLRRLVGPHVQFRMDLRDSSVITHDEGDLDQLVTALVMAARELLPVGGSVVVETDRVELDAGDLGQLPDGRPGANTVIAVSATGYGALRAQPSQSAEVLARRCGGVLRVTNRGDRTVAFEAYFPDAAARSQK